MYAGSVEFYFVDVSKTLHLLPKNFVLLNKNNFLSHSKIEINN